MTIEAMAIVRFDENGEITYHVAGDDRFRLFIVDERAPHDRVYEWTRREEREEVLTLVAGSPIGHSKDERHAAIEAVIHAAQDGRSHLSLVEETKA